MFRCRSTSWRLALTLVGSGCLFAAGLTASPPTPIPPTVVPGLVLHRTPLGNDYAALVLPAPTVSGLQSVAHDHVVIIDTSASQSGTFRTRSIAVAAEVCRVLPAGDRVCLVASDVTTEVLTADFVPVRSADLQVAFDRLEERVPLGSSNVELALRTAIEKFRGPSARSVLYIGDGFSTAQLIQTPAMHELVTALRSAAVPVNSLAIGPRIDLLLLGSLAQHTGGVVLVDEPNLVADRAPHAGDLAAVAGQLARAAVAPVFYPTSITTVPNIPSLLSQTLPPVRCDRETILLGKDISANKVQVKFTGKVRGLTREFSWVIGREDVNASTGFVEQAWVLAEGSQGMAMSWAGRALMTHSQNEYQAEVDLLAQAGLASSLTDPTNKSNLKSESLLDELQTKGKVRAEQLTIDVNLAIEQVRHSGRDNYQDAHEVLKRQLDTVVASTDVSADVRQALRKRLEAAARQLANDSEQFEQLHVALDRKVSQQEAMKKLMEQTQRDEEKMEQLIDRVRALLARGFNGNPDAFEDAEEVSRVAVELAPYSGMPNQDLFNSEAVGALDKARRLRAMRSDNMLAMLHQVELSHAPFPDNTPIVWPSPERWQWITESRKKWEAMDLKSYSKKERKIVSELNRPTTLNFTDESLDGVRQTIAERHGFDIVIDRVKLEEESVATDATDITLNVHEIALKNALKLLLDAKNLTYIIENEVMKITTKAGGNENRPLRVYSSADQLIPVNAAPTVKRSSRGGCHHFGGGG